MLGSAFSLARPAPSLRHLPGRMPGTGRSITMCSSGGDSSGSDPAQQRAAAPPPPLPQGQVEAAPAAQVIGEEVVHRRYLTLYNRKVQFPQVRRSWQEEAVCTRHVVERRLGVLPSLLTALCLPCPLPPPPPPCRAGCWSTT